MKKCYFKRLFHISLENLDGKTLYPRIPDNNLIKKGAEDITTPRVCMSPFIEGCLRSISISPMSMSYNIYTTLDVVEEQYIPDEKEVPDAMLTGEVWITEPVKLVYYGRLDVHARVDTAPCMGYPSDSNENGFVEAALFNYSIYAKSNNYQEGMKYACIEVIGQEDDDPEFLASLTPTDFTRDYYNTEGMEVQEFVSPT